MDLEKHPWARDGVTIAKALLESIEAQALEAYAGGLPKDGGFEGEEACGVLSGPAGDARLVDEETRLPNLANRYHAIDPVDYPRTGRMYFLVDPLKFSRAIKSGEDGGRPIKVLWHSHLDVGAYFSDTDAQTALAGGDTPAYDLAYLVVSVRGNGRGGEAKVDDRKLFIYDLASKRFVEAELRLA